MDLTNLEYPSDLRDDQLDIGNQLVRGLKAVGEVLWSTYFYNSPSIIKFCINYINGNGIVYGYGCDDSVS